MSSSGTVDVRPPLAAVALVVTVVMLVVVLIRRVRSGRGLDGAGRLVVFVGGLVIFITIGLTGVAFVS